MSVFDPYLYSSLMTMWSPTESMNLTNTPV